MELAKQPTEMSPAKLSTCKQQEETHGISIAQSYSEESACGTLKISKTCVSGFVCFISTPGEHHFLKYIFHCNVLDITNQTFA